MSRSHGPGARRRATPLEPEPGRLGQTPQLYDTPDSTDRIRRFWPGVGSPFIPSQDIKWK